ncbi:Na-translocating system protein MpsC family protein [Patulibacter sp.]|uniref:Na-translocating system protein MpsC family protein n=1 Tax=Patulibacter sp. TaxID=1912859 RepID=UPI0027246035|nr:Na-translocating system protein MpsC family protein [Patulibacter sp.]MDO9409359.1 Na-translocating system protein MpsC family protein [Patulibacter sp.]
MNGPESEAQRESSLQAEISTDVAKLHRDRTGRGPTSVQCHIHGDTVTLVLTGVVTKLEETLIEDGRAEAVDAQRSELNAVLAPEIGALVATALDRDVKFCTIGTSIEDDAVGITVTFRRP